MFCHHMSAGTPATTTHDGDRRGRGNGGAVPGTYHSYNCCTAAAACTIREASPIPAIGFREKTHSYELVRCVFYHHYKYIYVLYNTYVPSTSFRGRSGNGRRDMEQAHVSHISTSPARKRTRFRHYIYWGRQSTASGDKPWLLPPPPPLPSSLSMLPVPLSPRRLKSMRTRAAVETCFPKSAGRYI